MRSATVLGRPRGLVTFVRDFIKRVEGVAAIEFALIAPIMAMMFVGAVEMSQAITANRRVSQVASTVGDIVARASQNITNTGSGTSSLVDVMTVGSFLMSPFSASNLNIKVTMVGSTSTSSTTINTEWYCAYQGSSPSTVTCNTTNACLTSATAYTGLPSGLITSTSDYVVIATATYNYRPNLFDYFMKRASPSSNGVYTMTDTVYLKPRAAYAPLLLNGSTTPCQTF